ncbi:DUF3892 domain-containing protein [Marinococcus luteus]|uniref:DUF3892 domain-containing protein n=1 Tax=Marinococcus luteus TaxID=1122204 RepID=UPI002ACC6D8D|nr:DUF3892 domain-containing protein [Marinococcus luteus]MDZ5784612.1 DUF3892 domain-containing protein [Marinococcus luteus]
MIYATGISFKKEDVEDLKSIVRIQLESDENESWKINDEPINGWYSKETIHRWLKNYGDKGFEIKVKIKPYPELEPVEDNGVRYVRSVRDDSRKNNLLSLKAYYEN